MELAMLWLNVGLLVAGAAAAAIAWWQAIAAAQRRSEAEQASKEAASARRQAIEAQESAASALNEANDIAREARSVIAERLALEQQREARLGEYRDVRWAGLWTQEVRRDDPLTFELSNTGSTDARSVTLTLGLPGGDQTFRIGDIPARGSKRLSVYDGATYGMGGRRAARYMRLRDVPGRVHWLSPAGEPETRDEMFWGE